MDEEERMRMAESGVDTDDYQKFIQVSLLFFILLGFIISVKFPQYSEMSQ